MCFESDACGVSLMVTTLDWSGAKRKKAELSGGNVQSREEMMGARNKETAVGKYRSI